MGQKYTSAGAGRIGVVSLTGLYHVFLNELGRLGLPGPLATADTLLRRVDAAAHAASPLSPGNLRWRR